MRPRPILVALTICTVVAVMGGVPWPAPGPQPAGAAFPGTNGKIAFASSRGGAPFPPFNFDVYVMNADGSEPTRLTYDGAIDSSPAWSPDGSQIAFDSDRDGDPEVFLMNGDGSGQTNLTNNPAGDHDPAWSPDGSQIAFESNRDGGPHDFQIYLMDDDGSGQTNLSNNEASDGFPAWSPDGSQIAFDSDRDDNTEIYVMDNDGSNQTRLTNNTETDTSPAWSPDGAQIAFMSYRDGNAEIYVMDANGDNQTRLTNDGAIDCWPAWSPDGSQIAFVSLRDGNEEIYVMDPDGSDQTNLTSHLAVDNHPDWQPLPVYTVNSTNDVNDDTCDATHCSLREAINAANGGAGTTNTIAFNIAGAGPHTIQPGSALPTVTDPVIIDGYTQPGASPNTNPPGSGSNAVLKIELDGTNAGVGVNGLHITAGSSTVRGLVINRFVDANGIRIETNGANVIEGNFIGTDVAGMADLGNIWAGVRIEGAPANTIGGTTPGARNVISGNDTYGVRIRLSDATGNLVQGNFIGTKASGMEALGNSSRGVYIDGAPGNTIGGTIPGAGNVISGNGGVGVYIVLTGATGNLVQGNYIGTDITGTADLGNTLAGVRIEGAPNNTIGGTTPGAGNVISGNETYGVRIRLTDATGNVVQGNYIGTDVTGSTALGNAADGVRISDGPNNTIGGTGAGARNVISGNDSNGVVIAGGGATGNQVQGNYIGTDVDGTADLGNLSAGVYIDEAADITIGGPASEAANTIAYNTDEGVAVIGATTTGNAIRGNSIHSNGDLGIDLGPNGVTGNDEDDPDPGPNNLQNFPVITSAIPGSITIEGTFNSTASTIFALDFYASASCDGSGNGEGETYLGSTVVVTDGGGDVTFSVTLPATVSVGQFITATATDPSGSTSEFSACFVASVPVDTRVGQPDTIGDCADGTPALTCLTDQPTGLHQAPTAGAAGLGEAASGSTDGLYYADTGNDKVKVEVSGTVYEVAGGGGGCGGPPPPFDGCPATQAILDSPRDVFVHGTDLYIADAGHCLVRKVDLKTDIITTVAGSLTSGYPPVTNCGPGGDGGAATSAQLNSPRGVYVDSAGENLYIADTTNCRIRKVDLTGMTSPPYRIDTVAGTTTCGDSGDAGPATAAELRNPHDVYGLLPSEDLVIADSGNHRIRRLDLPSGNIYPFAGAGTQGDSLGGGVATNAQFDFPEALAAADHRVYVADTKNDRVLKVDALANTIMVAVPKEADCPCPPGVELDQPKGVTIASDRRSIDISNTDAAIIVTAGISPTGEQTEGFTPTQACGNLPGVSTIDWGLPVLLLGLLLARKRIGALFVRLWSVAGLAWRRRTDSVPP